MKVTPKLSMIIPYALLKVITLVPNNPSSVLTITPVVVILPGSTFKGRS